jgi:hypothetical protein
MYVLYWMWAKAMLGPFPGITGVGQYTLPDLQTVSPVPTAASHLAVLYTHQPGPCYSISTCLLTDLSVPASSIDLCLQFLQRLPLLSHVPIDLCSQFLQHLISLSHIPTDMCPLFLWHLGSLSRVTIDQCHQILQQLDSLYHILSGLYQLVLQLCVLPSLRILWPVSTVSCTHQLCPLSLVTISCVHCSCCNTTSVHFVQRSAWNKLQFVLFTFSKIAPAVSSNLPTTGRRPHHLFCCTIFHNIFLRVVTFSHTPDTYLELKDATWRGPSTSI